LAADEKYYGKIDGDQSLFSSLFFAAYQRG